MVSSKYMFQLPERSMFCNETRECMGSESLIYSLWKHVRYRSVNFKMSFLCLQIKRKKEIFVWISALAS